MRRTRYISASSDACYSCDFCRRYVETTETLKKLYLVNITRSDVGDYKCQLDDRGRLEKSVTLHIYRK